MPRRLDAFAAAVLLVCCAGWGLNQVAVKVSVTGIPPVLGAGLRSAVAFALLLAWCLWRRDVLLRRDGTGGHGLLLGVIFAAEFVLIYGGLAFTTASRSVIFLYMAPFMVALGAHFLIPGERLTTASAAGLGLAFAGLCLAFADALRLPGRRELIGDLMEAGGAFLWAVTTVLVKKRSDLPMTPRRTLFYQLSVSAVVLLGLALLIGERGISQPTPLVLISFAYQAVAIAFASYLTWFWLLERYPASQLASFSFWTPLFGVAAGAVLLRERVTGYLGAAVALVAAGIYLVNRPSR
ncbi:MAG TPA: DMT family transporter [Candidatus Methylomirabilis sp.]|nr:DMT family transporter [Candidatus Methylomirabilis sp.]